MKSTWISLIVFAVQTTWAQPAPDCVRAIDAHRSGQYDSAVSSYQACLAAQPGNLEARSNLGAALAHLGSYEEAVQQYKIALQSADSQVSTRIRLNLGLAYYKSGQIPAATAEFATLHRDV